MKKLILVFLMVCGFVANMASAEEMKLTEAQKEAKNSIEEYERFKAKHPKTYNACLNGDTNSKYYKESVCDRLFRPYFTALKFRVREDGSRYYQIMTWDELEKKYGEEGKKTLLKYGINWQNGVNDMGMAEYLAKGCE